MKNSRAPSVNIAGLGGSLGADSTSLAALKAVLARAEFLDASIRLFHVRALDLPMYDPDSQTAPAAARSNSPRSAPNSSRQPGASLPP